MNTDSYGPPDFVELHDARMAPAALAFRLGGDVVLSFLHLVTYHSLSPDRFAVLARAAELTLSGCRGVTVDGLLSDPTVIAEGHVLLRTDERPLTEYLTAHPATSLTLITTSGAQMAFFITGARLTLSQPHRRMRDWTGPLLSE
jgi:hypothetical protein